MTNQPAQALHLASRTGRLRPTDDSSGGDGFVSELCDGGVGCPAGDRTDDRASDGDTTETGCSCADGGSSHGGHDTDPDGHQGVCVLVCPVPDRIGGGTDPGPPPAVEVGFVDGVGVDVVVVVGAAAVDGVDGEEAAQGGAVGAGAPVE